MANMYQPDIRLEKADIDTYVVPAGKTVRVGAPVKISADANPVPEKHSGYVIEEATAATDISIGVALGHISRPRESFGAGEFVRVAHIFDHVCAAFAKGNITAGQRVVPASGGGFVAAPAFAAGGSTLVNSPGIALNSASDGQAFTYAPLHTSYTAA